MNGDFREDLKRACEVMQKGGVILYPTDTIWGIMILIMRLHKISLM